MREELYEYYERELNYLRQMGREFAGKYDRVAGRLLLDENSCADPHVERLLEGFAFLAARIHLRIDDDFPRITEDLLNMVHPGYLRPHPSMTVVECLPDSKRTAGANIPRGSVIVTKGNVEGMAVPLPLRYMYSRSTSGPSACSTQNGGSRERLQTPVRASGGGMAVAAARLRLRCSQDVVFQGLPLSRLRFYLSGDVAVTYPLYELLASNCIEIQLRDPLGMNRIISLSPDRIRMVGFAPDESLLPFERRSLDGHRLLLEYFALPEKFLFFDLEGLEPLSEAGFGAEAEIVFLFSRFEKAERQQTLEQGLNHRTFRLGCTPAINLFRQTAEPILLNQTRDEYTIVPDSRYSSMVEIFSLEDVIATNPKLRESVILDHVHAYRHQSSTQRENSFWSATRHFNQLGEREPSAMTISVVDLNGQISDPEVDVLTVRCLCTNHDVPSRLALGSPDGAFEVVGPANAKKVTALLRPTPSYDPPNGRGQMWRLISHLSLNYLSLTEEGRTALKEILRLHNFTDSIHLENQAGSILQLKSSPHFALVESEYGLVPARGTKVEVELDEQQFAGAGIYLFAAVIERFLAGYASINSFTQLSVRTNQRREPFPKWPPRAGTQVLL